jgi:predicted transcriptional regulator
VSVVREIPGVPHNGTPTSIMAAEVARFKAGSVALKVLTLIRQKGPRGATADEVLVEMSLDHQTGSARVSGLAKSGLILPSGEKRPTRRGCQAAVYVTPDNMPPGDYR